MQSRTAVPYQRTESKRNNAHKDRKKAAKQNVSRHKRASSNFKRLVKKNVKLHVEEIMSDVLQRSASQEAGGKAVVLHNELPEYLERAIAPKYVERAKVMWRSLLHKRLNQAVARIQHVLEEQRDTPSIFSGESKNVTQKRADYLLDTLGTRVKPLMSKPQKFGV